MLGVLLLGTALQLRTLTLDQAVRAADENQPTLRQNHALTEVAVANIDYLKAPLLPQVTLKGAYQQATANFVAPAGTLPSSVNQAHAAANFNTFGFLTASLTATQLIYDFGQTYGLYRAAKSSADSQVDTERASKLLVELTARQTFFAARAQKDLVQVAKDTLANQELHLHQTEGFVHAGTHPEIDLATQRTAVANAKVALITAENNYETSKAQLNQAMGVEGPTDFDVASDTLPPIPGEDEGTEKLVHQAIPARPEITSLDKQIEAQDWTVHSNKGGYGPTISAQSQFNYQGQNLDGLTWNWSASLLLNWQIFQGFQDKSQIRMAEWTKAALVAQRDSVRQGVRLEVEQARLAVRAAKASVGAVDEALFSAKEQLRLAEGRYKAGAGGAVELADAQTAMSNAAAQKVQAEFNLASTRAQLLKALGRM
jgi:outer membrane protein